MRKAVVGFVALSVLTLGGIANADDVSKETLREKARNGDVYAKGRLAGIYMSENKYKKASDLLKDLAEKGHPSAHSMLGRMYRIGSGEITSDKSKALHHYVIAARKGHTLAAQNTAQMYYRGEGADRDLVKAYKWAVVAGSQDYPESQELVRVLEQEMSPETLKEAKRAFHLLMAKYSDNFTE